MIKTATWVKDLADYNGEAALYRLDPPIELTDECFECGSKTSVTHKYVVVSAAVVLYAGPETYIFPADKHGEVTSWSELPGSYRGGLDHATALDGAGYTMTGGV